ncbi:MAG: hypothetical protein GXP40_13085 [Chloroflexi bacterium]|nr:hypothetical protein [Chloroflexota bacterium]
MTIILLSAPSGLGKTLACVRTINFAKQDALRVAGIISLPSYLDKQKKSILLQDVSTGKTRPMAEIARTDEKTDIGSWVFDPRVVAWGQSILRALPPCDLLFIDEIGPLELEQGRGLTYAIEALHTADYRLAVVTVRPALLETLQTHLSSLETSTLTLTKDNLEEIPQLILQSLPDAKETP